MSWQKIKQIQNPARRERNPQNTVAPSPVSTSTHLLYPPLQPLPRIHPGSFPELFQTPVQRLRVLFVEAAVESVERRFVLTEETFVEKRVAGRPSAEKDLFFQREKI